jgi:hypothetical protein
MGGGSFFNGNAKPTVKQKKAKKLQKNNEAFSATAAYMAHGTKVNGVRSESASVPSRTKSGAVTVSDGLESSDHRVRITSTDFREGWGTPADRFQSSAFLIGHASSSRRVAAVHISAHPVERILYTCVSFVVFDGRDAAALIAHTHTLSSEYFTRV